METKNLLVPAVIIVLILMLVPKKSRRYFKGAYRYGRKLYKRRKYGRVSKRRYKKYAF